MNKIIERIKAFVRWCLMPRRVLTAACIVGALVVMVLFHSFASVLGAFLGAASAVFLIQRDTP